MVNLQDETKVGLLTALRDAMEDATASMKFPVQMQERDTEEPEPTRIRAYNVSIPNLASYAKKAPFILNQVVTSEDSIRNVNQGTGIRRAQEFVSTCVVRSVFCIYHPDEQEGGLALLNAMEAVRVALLERPLLNKRFELDLYEGLSQMVYPVTDDRGFVPFYIGEIVTQWKMPPIHRIDTVEFLNGSIGSGPATRSYP